MRAALALAFVLASVGVVDAHPIAPIKSRSKPAAGGKAPAAPAKKDGGHARVTFGQLGVLRAPREIVGRREEPLTAEEDTARQIEKLLRGPLRNGITGLFVADAKTGEPLFAVNADDGLNPASNVKMISTATALELLGPQFKYPTRLLGPDPDPTGTIRGNVYLLGSWDPTLSTADLDDIAVQLASKGVKRLEGDVVVGTDPTRDGIYRAVIPIEITAGAPGLAPVATPPAGFDLLTIKMTAKTAKVAMRRPRLSVTAQTIVNPAGHTRVEVTIGGLIGKGATTVIPFTTQERTQMAAHAMRAALRMNMIDVVGDVRVRELGDFISDSVASTGLPHELGRHESSTLSEIVAVINKWSVNWLADRVIMTAAALANKQTPTMEVALEAMYGWLERHTHLDRKNVQVDTGSGLSYRTRITPQELVSIVRSAGGFSETTSASTQAWLDSLAVAGVDGTLGRRFRANDVRGRIRAKTGSLSTVIALSGLLDIDPSRPLAFSIVTNGDRPLSKAYVRKAHEQLVHLICQYISKTAKTPVPEVLQQPAAPLHPSIPEEAEETEPDAALDAETAGTSTLP